MKSKASHGHSTWVYTYKRFNGFILDSAFDKNPASLYHSLYQLDFKSIWQQLGPAFVHFLLLELDVFAVQGQFPLGLLQDASPHGSQEGNTSGGSEGHPGRRGAADLDGIAFI